MSQTFKTKAVILRSVAYGDTSLIVSALTELFGLQTYLIKGVRKATKTQSTKAPFFQPAALLEMVVYHNPTKQMNFVKEYQWSIIYKNVYSNIIKNAIALYTIELLLKCLKQPDENTTVYYFIEDVLLAIDNANTATTANLPIFIALHLPSILGLQIADDYSTTNTILDLKDGCFVPTIPAHQQIVQEPFSKIISTFLKTMQPTEVENIKLNGQQRKSLLEAIEVFYQLHISEFGKIKSLPILHEILN